MSIRSLVLFAIAILSAAPARAVEIDLRQTLRDQLKGTVQGFAVAQDGALLISSSGIHRSTDMGKTWKRVGPEFDLGGPLHLARDGTLYAAGITTFAADGKTMMPEGDHRVSLHLSKDAGATWSEIHAWKKRELTVNSIARAPKGALLLSCGSPFGGQGMKGILRSTDDGKSWTPAWSADAVYGIEAAGKDTLYAGTGSGVFVSKNDGASWSATGQGRMTVSLRVQGNTLLAGTMEGLYRSTDKGRTWAMPDPALKDIVPLPVILGKGRVGALLNHAVSDGNVTLLLSADGGKRWKAAATKIVRGTVDGIFADEKSIYLWARGRGVLRAAHDGQEFKPLFP